MRQRRCGGTPVGHGTQVRCPLYRKDYGRQLCCEGITDECTLQLNFRTAAAKNQQLRIFCAARYGFCEVYEAIMKAKYSAELDREREAMGHG